MGSKRDNLALDKTDITGAHYHGKSYHKRLEHFDLGFANWHQSCTFTFFLDVGQRCTFAKSGSTFPSAEINRLE